jgi:mRNA-degrading endonuclease RelE of RelBE toxin-antitoxin system
MHRVALSRRAERDLRRIGRGETATRIREALQALTAGEATLDVKALSGAPPWHRLRVGDYRVLYRPVAADENAAPEVAWLVARIVHRRDLERAIQTLT